MIKIEDLLKSLDEYGIEYKLNGDKEKTEELIMKLDNIVDKMRKEIKNEL